MEDYQVDPKNKVIRAIYNRFYWVKDKGDYRELHAVVKFDMAFYIPNFVWNWMLGKGFNVFFKSGLEQLRKS